MWRSLWESIFSPKSKKEEQLPTITKEVNDILNLLVYGYLPGVQNGYTFIHRQGRRKFFFHPDGMQWFSEHEDGTRNTGRLPEPNARKMARLAEDFMEGYRDVPRSSL